MELDLIILKLQITKNQKQFIMMLLGNKLNSLRNSFVHFMDYYYNKVIIMIYQNQLIH